MAQEDPVRHDLFVILPNPATVIGEGIAASLLRYLAASRVITPTNEALPKDWTEVYCEPGASAHEPFSKGTYEGPTPVFKECWFRWGTTPTTLVINDQSIQTYFYLAFRGCAFSEPLGPFRKRFREIMQGTARLLQAPHEAIPEHQEVAPEDAPKDKRLKPSNRGGQAGTTVEEW